MLKRSLVGLALALLVVLPVVAFTSSVVVNEPALHYGDYVTFTLTYPQEAAKQARQNQFPDNPIVQVNCYPDSSGTLDYLGQTIVEDKTKVAGGWTATTRPLRLYYGHPWAGRQWDSGAADCVAMLAYFTYDKAGLHTHVLDSIRFGVEA